MTKIRNISEFQSSFSFISIADQYEIFQRRFLKSDLGKIYLSIPWNEVVLTLGLKENRKGQLSIRLNRSYRAIYIVQEKNLELVEIIEVNKHDY